MSDPVDYTKVKGDDGLTDDERRLAKMDRRERERSATYDATGGISPEQVPEPDDARTADQGDAEQEYQAQKVDDLKAEVARRNEVRVGTGEPPLSTSGTKAELAARLAEDDRNGYGR